MRGLRTKTNNFLTSVACCDASIIFISETWLNNDFSNGELVDNTYNIFRQDRNCDTSNKVIGGEC